MSKNDLKEIRRPFLNTFFFLLALRLVDVLNRTEFSWIEKIDSFIVGVLNIVQWNWSRAYVSVAYKYTHVHCSFRRLKS